MLDSFKKDRGSDTKRIMFLNLFKVALKKLGWKENEKLPTYEQLETGKQNYLQFFHDDKQLTATKEKEEWKWTHENSCGAKTSDTQRGMYALPTSPANKRYLEEKRVMEDGKSNKDAAIMYEKSYKSLGRKPWWCDVNTASNKIAVAPSTGKEVACADSYIKAIHGNKIHDSKACQNWRLAKYGERNPTKMEKKDKNWVLAQAKKVLPFTIKTSKKEIVDVGLSDTPSTVDNFI